MFLILVKKKDFENTMKLQKRPQSRNDITEPTSRLNNLYYLCFYGSSWFAEVNIFICESFSVFERSFNDGETFRISYNLSVFLLIFQSSLFSGDDNMKEASLWWTFYYVVKKALLKCTKCIKNSFISLRTNTIEMCDVGWATLRSTFEVVPTLFQNSE